jgi:signal transduction histidine kinase/ligand-binding sensor domain-containing protein
MLYREIPVWKTVRKTVRKTIRKPVWLLFTLLLLQRMASLQAQELTLKQMDHTAWTARDGAPMGVNSIAEANDGTLWLATRGGLFNFDGLHFSPFVPAPGEPPLPSIELRSVLISADGTLWVAPWMKNLVRVKDGHVHVFDERDGLPDSVIVQMRQAPDGAMWALSTGVLYRLSGDRWKPAIPSSENLDHVYQFYFDRAGTLWLSTLKSIYSLPRGASKLQKTAESGQGVAGFIELPNGTLWANAVSPVSGVRRLSVPGHPSLHPLSIPGDAFALTADPNGDLWIASNRDGVERIAAAGLTPDSKGIIGPRDKNLQAYDQRAGLSGIAAFDVIRDTNGTLWVGTTRGLDRFRNPTLTKLADPSIEGDVGVTACPNGIVWMGSGDFMISIDHGVITHHKMGDLWGIYCDRNNSLWYNRVGKIVELRNGQEQNLPMPPTNLPSCILQLVGDEDDLFATCSHNALWRRRSNQWTKVEVPGFPKEAPLTILRDQSGRLWSGYTDNRVGLLEGTTGKTYPIDNAPGLGPVQALLVATSGVFAGGAYGLAALHGDYFQSLFTTDPQAVQGISGLVQAHNGDLWLNGARGVFRLPAPEVARALRWDGYRMQSQHFSGDGLVGFTYQGYELPTAVLATDGRIWIATSSTGVYIDPGKVTRDTVPPVTSILTFTDNEVPRNVANLSVPPGKHTLRIRYFGAHLMAAERVSYRYRLDGQDAGWQDVGNRTEAVYTNLKPGTYTFHVAASNGEGVWGEAPAPLVFEVMPAFYQRWWFLALCIVASALLLGIAFRMRFEYVTAQLRRRLEERAQERIRIARDLHDTLLQGVQGLILCFHSDIEEVPEDQPARAMLEKTLTRAERVIADGRERVRTLRSEESLATDLPEALAQVSAMVAPKATTAIEFLIEGKPRPLRAIVHDEMYYIAREAITNALLHAHSSRIEVEIEYGQTHLRIRCRDNGTGMTREQVDAGSPVGHWGLTGMKERASRIGGKFDIWSTPGAGTEIEVSVPASTAYFVQSAKTRWTFGRK